MKYSLRTEHTQVTDLDQGHLDKKISRLEKHVTTPYMMDIAITRNTHHQKGNVYICTINIEQGKKVFHAERDASTIASAIDETASALEQELAKAHEKRKKHHG